MIDKKEVGELIASSIYDSDDIDTALFQLETSTPEERKRLIPVVVELILEEALFGILSGISTKVTDEEFEEIRQMVLKSVEDSIGNFS